MLSGGCLCGAVRYETHGPPFHETHCHCRTCQLQAGAAFVTWFSVRRAEFRLTAGEPVWFRSSDHGRRAFCGRCGTALLFEDDRLDEVDVTAASLDDPAAITPRDHVWVSRGIRWREDAAGLPQHTEGREG